MPRFPVGHLVGERVGAVVCGTRRVLDRVVAVDRTERDVLDAVLYILRTGCQWRYLPGDLPPKSTVYDYFARWRDDGTWQRIFTALDVVPQS